MSSCVSALELLSLAVVGEPVAVGELGDEAVLACSFGWGPPWGLGNMWISHGAMNIIIRSFQRCSKSIITSVHQIGTVNQSLLRQVSLAYIKFALWNYESQSTQYLQFNCPRRCSCQPSLHALIEIRNCQTRISYLNRFLHVSVLVVSNILKASLVFAAHCWEKPTGSKASPAHQLISRGRHDREGMGSLSGLESSRLDQNWPALDDPMDDVN